MGLEQIIQQARQAQAQRAMTHRPTAPVTKRDMADALQANAMMFGPIPIAGDLVGLMADAAMYATKPEERTLGNYALSALGALPFVPAAGTLKKASKAENIAAGLYHPIGGGLKLDRPLSEMRAVQEPIRELPPRQLVSPEMLQGGRLIPFIGDRTAANRMLTEIDGRPLSAPVHLEGGPDFMRTHAADGAAWASGKGIISKLGRVTKEAAESGNPVYGVYSAMSHTGGDYSTMMTDALLAQLRVADLKKKDIKELDKQVRGLRPEWPGLLNADAPSLLRESGPLRLALIDRMKQKEFVKAGFPDMASTRAAILERDLLDAPLWSSGYAIARLDPQGRAITAPKNPHSTYNTQLAGEYVGGTELGVPREIMFRDLFASRRAENKPVAGDDWAFQRSGVVQEANQRWLDEVMTFLESQRNAQPR